MRWMKNGGGTLAVSMVVAASWPAPARAQTPPRGDKVDAEALFEDARKLATSGKYVDACPKFAESERLDPSAATLLNLASCWEKLGKTATAWATYREAASAANATGRADYLGIAQRHADALSPRLARLTLSVAQPVDGIEILRDGIVIAPASWGVAFPIDTGAHLISATAPAHKPWSTTVDVASDGSAATVTVPPLDAAPPEALGASTFAPGGSPSAATPTAVAEGASDDVARARARSKQRIGAGVVGGLGVVGVVTGAVFAGVAESKYDDSVNHDCLPSNKNACNAHGVSERNDARTAGDVASWALGLGAVALAGGLVLWLTAPKVERDGAAGVAVSIVPTPGGATVEGSF